MTHIPRIADKDTFEASRYPLPVRIVNSVASALAKLGIRSNFSPEDLIRQARSSTDLSDFGDIRVDEPLSILLNAIEEEAELNFMGQLMARQIVRAALTNRLKIQSRLTANPELLSTEIERPMFIIGYPRTGTTLLHSLLDLGTEHRTLKMYEALSPVPPENPGDPKRDPRIKLANKFVGMTHYISAQVPVIHPLSARGPDECLKLIENTFISPHFLLYFQAPTYWHWLKQQSPESFTPIYAFHRQQLQLLSQGEGGLKWILKAPIHLFFLEALLKTYPDARIIYLHRDPNAAIPSFCSLLAVSRAMASNRVDLRQIGEFALDLYETSYERSAHALAVMNKPERVCDIDYQSLVDDPVATLFHIYEYFGNTPGPQMEKSVRNWLTANPQHKHGVHRYSPEKFSLNRQLLARLQP